LLASKCNLILGSGRIIGYVLFSIRYGIPKIMTMEKSAMRIIGLFKKLSGETVAH
jgi:hypothetical protein